MRNRLPPIEQLEAFILAARSPSFRVAAEHCALSPAAFSRRIQAFGHSVGATLFVRSATGARLTPEGMRCLAAFEPAYAELRRATDAMFEREGQSSAVTLSLSHSLAVGWLIPRLDRLHETHPEVDLQLSTDRTPDPVRRGIADLGICSSENDFEGVTSDPLLPVAIAPVASPEQAMRFAAQGSDLSRERLLAYTRPAELWEWWGRAAKQSVGTAAMRFDIQQALYEAAALGHGIALAIGPTIAPFLESGRLIRLALPSVPYPGQYRIVSASKRTGRRTVACVRRWLINEARNTPALA